MQITEIKAGTSVNVFTGESWLKVDALCIKDLGETDDEAFDKLTSKVDELEAKWKAKRLAGQQVLPVIQKEDIKEKIKSFNEGWEVVKKKIELVAYKEDAQEVLNCLPEYKDYYEAKIMILKKPSKKQQ